MQKISTLLFFTFFLSTILRAQEQNPEMETDRPNQTQSPTIVPKGTIQIETGLTNEWDKPYFNELRNSDLTISTKTLQPTALFRLGISNKLELRLNIDYEKENKRYFRENITDEKVIEKGLKEAGIGGKLRLVSGKAGLPDIGILANLIFPLQKSGSEKRLPVPEGRLLFSNKISEKLELQYNLGYRKQKNEEEYKGEGLYTFTGNVKFSDKITWFGEVFGQKSKEDEAEHSFDTGLLFKILPNFQVDIIAGVGLNKAAPNTFAGGGLTWRIPN